MVKASKQTNIKQSKAKKQTSDEWIYETRSGCVNQL